MKKKYIIIPSLALLLLLAAGTASAYGGQGMMERLGKNADPVVVAQNFAEKMTADASILGISVDEMKAGWAAGKNLHQIAQEKGITQDQLKTKMKAARDAEMKAHLQILVSQGKITQAQADSRLTAMQNRVEKAGGKFAGKGRGQGTCGAQSVTK